MPIDPRMVAWESESLSINPDMVKWEDEEVSPRKTAKREADMADKIAANPAMRFALAASSPIRAGLEFLPDEYGGKYWQGKNQRIADMQKAGAQDQSWLEQHISTGADIAGNILSPASLGLMKVMPYASGATGVLPRLGQAAKNITTGGIGGALFSQMQPVGEMEDFAKAKGKQAEHGALWGALFPAGMEAVKGVGGLASNLTGPFRASWRDSAARQWLDEILGEGKQATKASITGRGEIAKGSPVSVADAIAAGNMNTTNKFGSALVRAEDILDTIGGPQTDLAKSAIARQEAARAAEIDRIAQTPEAREAIRQQLKNEALPGMMAELEAANTAGKMLPKYVDRLNAKRTSMVDALQQAGKGFADENVLRQGINRLQKGSAPGWSQAKIGRLTDRTLEQRGLVEDFMTLRNQRKAEGDFIKMQADSLAEHGLFPLNVDRVVASINSKLMNPKIGPSDDSATVLRHVKDKLLEWKANGNGTIDAHAVHTIRMDVINEKVADLMKGRDPASSEKLAAKMLGEIRPLLDDSIVAAGGTKWKEALKKYSEIARQGDAMDVGVTLQKGLTGTTGKERQLSFANALEKASEKRSPDSGKPMIEALTQSEKDAASRVQREIEREVERGNLGSNVKLDVMNIAEKGKGKMEIPHILQREATFARWLLHMTGNDADIKIARDIHKLMKTDPDAFVEKYLKDVPPSYWPQLITKLEKAAISGGSQQGE